MTLPAIDTTPNPDMTRQLAALNVPWLTGALYDAFKEAWTSKVIGGDANLALAYVRESDAYAVAFAGNRREDGSLRLDEDSYLAYRESFNQEIQSLGINPDVMANNFVSLIEGEVSYAEFTNRVGAVTEGVLLNMEEVKQWYSENFGLTLSDASIMASALDPTLHEEIIQERISQAQVGGYATSRGFRIDYTTADRLVDEGIIGPGARDLFTRASQLLPTLQELQVRHDDPGDDFDLDDFLSAEAFGDYETASHIRRLVDAESSLFAQRQPVFDVS